MPKVFVDELREQRMHAAVLLHQAEMAGDDEMVTALQGRLDELSEIAARNGLFA
jgi:hypothetical protein